jgi:nitrate reductase beta subunit
MARLGRAFGFTPEQVRQMTIAEAIAYLDDAKAIPAATYGSTREAFEAAKRMKHGG